MHPAGPTDLAVGDEVEMDVGPVAHGGICVARAGGPAGRVVFVRYALPGERVVVRITEVRPGSFCRGEAVRILRADPRRIEAPCRHFGPGGCGGCDFQHAAPDLQREMKAAVVAEQLRRLAGISWPVVVEALPGGGFGWRTRVRWAVGPAPSGDRPSGGDKDRGRGGDDDRGPRGHGDRGQGGDDDRAPGDDPDRRRGRDSPRGGWTIGPRRYRSHAVVPLGPQAPCLIAAAGLTDAAAALRVPRGADEVTLVRSADGPAVASWLHAGRPLRARSAGPGAADERAAGRTFAVGATGFWQAHAHAADTLCDAVRDALRGVPLTGRTAWDLYGGVGLFAAVLADLVGPAGFVTTVEHDREASTLAALNLRDLPQAVAVRSRVDAALKAAPVRPPRATGPDASRRAGHAPAAPASPPRGLAGGVDAVVLDPPRSGAGPAVCRTIAERGPGAIVYVACDPAALARDTAALNGAGYRLDALRAFDAFPQTHHVECVARFVPA